MLLVKFDLLRHTLNKDVVSAKVATTLTKECDEPMKKHERSQTIETHMVMS